MKNKLSITDTLKKIFNIKIIPLEDKINIQFLNSVLKKYPLNNLSTFSSEEKEIQYDIIYKITTFSDNIILNNTECLFYINRYLRSQFSNMRTFLDKEKTVYKQNKFINEKYAYFIELLYNNNSLESLKAHINEEPHFIHIFNEIKNFEVKKICCDIHFFNTEKRKKDDPFFNCFNRIYLNLLDQFNPELHLYSNSTFCNLYISNNNSKTLFHSENLRPFIFKNKKIFKHVLEKCIIPQGDLLLITFIDKMFSLYQEKTISDFEFQNNITIAKPFIENNELFLKCISNSIFKHIDLSGLIILNNETPNFYQAIKETNNRSVYKEYIHWDNYNDAFKYFIQQDYIKNQNTTKNIANVFILNGNEQHLLFIYDIFKNDENFIKYLTSLFINAEQHCQQMSTTTKEKIGNNIQNKIPFINRILSNIKNEKIILAFLISFNELNLAFASSELDLNDDNNYNKYDSVIHWIFSTCSKTVFSVNLKNYNIFNQIKENYTFENLLFKYIKINKPDFLSNIDFQDNKINFNIQDIYNLFQNKLLQQTFNIEKKQTTIKRL